MAPSVSPGEKLLSPPRHCRQTQTVNRLHSFVNISILCGFVGLIAAIPRPLRNPLLQLPNAYFTESVTLVIDGLDTPVHPELDARIIKILPQQLLIAAALLTLSIGVDLPWLGHHTVAILTVRGAMIGGTLCCALLSRLCHTRLAAEALVVCGVLCMVTAMAVLGWYEGTYLTIYMSAVYQVLVFVAIFATLRLSTIAFLTLLTGVLWFWGYPILLNFTLDPRLFASHLVGFVIYGSIILTGNHLLYHLWTKEAHLRVYLEEHTHHLRELATRDGLTGAYNFRHFQEMLGHLVTEACSQARPLCLCLFDLDGFKAINDQFGHAYGNLVLQHLAKCTTAAIRCDDAFFRIGGDEFAVILPGTLPKNAQLIAERIQALLATGEPLDEESSAAPPRPIYCSMGIASISPNCACPEALIKAADHALYLAKDAGRGQVAIAGIDDPVEQHIGINA